MAIGFVFVFSSQPDVGYNTNGKLLEMRAIDATIKKPYHGNKLGKRKPAEPSPHQKAQAKIAGENLNITNEEMQRACNTLYQLANSPEQTDMNLGLISLVKEQLIQSKKMQDQYRKTISDVYSGNSKVKAAMKDIGLYSQPFESSFKKLQSLPNDRKPPIQLIGQIQGFLGNLIKGQKSILITSI
ncbi:hypothetical protein PGT21_022441 [Puccinia graminis f. sp. tritici]|uniref:Uncharacterized protein n=1 Tax=Puccinia graminis f. sp. tritici TaxID=56615 RepID=A0A5B0PLL6_PUCGR|nr:hypothetical protein PGT21_022441 [Puccinia graminis f. sp. tritici]